MALTYYRPFFELEITLSLAKDLKNVNWRHGDLKPYVVLWVDPESNSTKCSTEVAQYGDDTHSTWDETLVVPLMAPIDESTLCIDIVHANADEDVKPLIGSARIPLSDIVDDVGIGKRAQRKLQLKRPSGRPQGKLELEITVRDGPYHASETYHTPAYGVPAVSPPLASKDYPVLDQYDHAAPPSAESSYGMGTGLAVGAVAGVLGGLALAEGFDYLEDKADTEDVAERVEKDLDYDDGGGGGYGDDGGCGNDGGGE